MRPQARSEAAAILKTARLVTGIRGRWGFVQWKDGDQARHAFWLYNEHAGRGYMGIGCAPCHSKVFNWLMDVVMEGVEAGQMEIEQA